MRDPNRIPKVLLELSILWQQNPDSRFGQLFHWINSFRNTQATHNSNGFYAEDDEWLKAIKELQNDEPSSTPVPAEMDSTAELRASRAIYPSNSRD